MARKGKRGGFRTRTRTIVKYRNRAVRVAGRARKGAGALAKERGATTIYAAAIGYLDAQRATSQGFGAQLAKIPTFGGAGWEATVGVAAHFYHKSNRGARWADKLATASLAIAAYKFARNRGGAAISGGWDE